MDDVAGAAAGVSDVRLRRNHGSAKEKTFEDAQAQTQGELEGRDPGSHQVLALWPDKDPHSVCPHCGFYAGREVVRIEEEL